MITPGDKDYQQTKRLKRNGTPLEPPFRELAAWVGANYGVHVLNVVYDTIEPGSRPRLAVVLETEKDAQKFRVPPGNFNEIDQKRVKEHFETILAEQRDLRFNTAWLLVIFEAFEPVAKLEALWSVTNEEISRLKARLANEDLWEIHRGFDQVTFFFYTRAQVKQYEAAGLRDLYSQEYSCLVRAYDELAISRSVESRSFSIQKRILTPNIKATGFITTDNTRSDANGSEPGRL
jgi:hypothetical protein